MFAPALMAELEGVEAAGLSMSAAPDVARARFEDGAARQAPASFGVVETWRLRALVKPGRLEAFRTWADAQGAGWFDFLAGGGDWLQGRFVGGAGRIGYRQVAPRAGAARWTADLEIERRGLQSPKGNMIFWPWYAEIKSDLALGSTLQAERTGLEGAGAARQVARERAEWRAWRLTAQVPGERLFEFIHWLRSNRMGWIWLPAENGGAWRARIAGGAGGAALRQVGTRAGAARWEATLSLETPAPVEVKPNVGRSIFDPAVALGDASRVYFRMALPFRIEEFRTGSWRIIAGAPPGQRLESVGLPRKFVAGGGPAFFSTIEVRFGDRFRLRLIEPGDASGNVAGPQLTPAARRGLAFIMAWGGQALRVVIGDQDPSEPFTFNAAGAGLWTQRLIDYGVFRVGPIDVAVAWNAPGANNTGFLADFFTTRGGAAAP